MDIVPLSLRLVRQQKCLSIWLIYFWPGGFAFYCRALDSVCFWAAAIVVDTGHPIASCGLLADPVEMTRVRDACCFPATD